jgi:hypothetical protein
MITPSISIDRKQKKVTIEMALEAAHPSKGTGKTMVIASTRGLRTSTERFAHRPISYTANVFSYPTRPVNSSGSAENSTGAAAAEPSITGSSRKSSRPHKFKKEKP